MYVNKGSSVSFMDASRVTFINNVATRYGGAIFADAIDCSQKNIIDTQFKLHNTAIVAGDPVYFSLSQLCNGVHPNFTLRNELFITSPDKLILPSTAHLNAMHTLFKM